MLIICFEKAGRWAFFLAGVSYGSSRLASLKVSDAPLREAAIKKATEEHHKHLAEVDKTNAGKNFGKGMYESRIC